MTYDLFRIFDPRRHSSLEISRIKAPRVHPQGTTRCIPTDVCTKDAKQTGQGAGRVQAADFRSSTKFALAMENAVVKDYVSEKVFDALLAGALPLYDGAPRVGRLLPDEGAILKTADFPDARLWPLL